MINKDNNIELLQLENKRLKKENDSMKKILLSKRFMMAEKVANIYNAFFPEGTFRRKAIKASTTPVVALARHNSKKLTRKLNKIINNKERIVVMHSIVWDAPLKQRPHHLAKCLANNNIFVIYFEPDEHVKNFRIISDNLITINSWEAIFDLEVNDKQKKYFFFNNVSNIEYDKIEKVNECGYKIVYEYIDEFDEDVAGALMHQMENWYKLPDLKPHLVLASATKLYNDAKKHFKNCKVILSKNAVNVEDFNYHNFVESVVPKDLVKIKKNNKPIVGYYGALAHWIDYELISKFAQENTDLNVVLIGVNYQNALKKLDQSIDNIYYLGPKDYYDLPLYSSKFDCAIIPFVTGQVAKGTSPVKLFEYMAMGLPMVGTRDLNECKGYDYVYLAHGSVEFGKMVKRALNEGRKKEVKEKLLEQAKKNSWEMRAKEIIKNLQ